MVHRKKYHKALGQPYLLIILDELNILADAMDKPILACATQPIWSTVIATTKVLMECVIALLIWNFWDSNLREQKCRIFNKVWRMRVSGKKHDCARQKPGWLLSTDFYMIKSKYTKQKWGNNKTETKIKTRIISTSPYCLISTKGRRWK